MIESARTWRCCGACAAARLRPRRSSAAARGCFRARSRTRARGCRSTAGSGTACRSSWSACRDRRRRGDREAFSAGELPADGAPAGRAPSRALGHGRRPAATFPAARSRPGSGAPRRCAPGSSTGTVARRTVHFDAHPGPLPPAPSARHRAHGRGSLRTRDRRAHGALRGRASRLRGRHAHGPAAPVPRARVLAPIAPGPCSAEGEVLDRGTAELVERVLGVAPVDLYGLDRGRLHRLAVRAARAPARERRGLHRRAARGRPPGAARRAGIGGGHRRCVARTAPMIRYDTGDLAIAVEGPCQCGRTLPLMGRVAGRAAATRWAGHDPRAGRPPRAARAARRLPAAPLERRGYELRPAPGSASADALAARASELLGGVTVDAGAGLRPPARRKTRVVV